MINSKEFNEKKILVTGGTGSIGAEIVKQLFYNYNPKTIRVFARSEDKYYALIHKFPAPINHRLRFIVGDVRDKDRLRLAMENIDIVFHAAALKHVPICEDNPFEAVKTNILGTQNVIDLARELNVKKVIGISTDKVVDPTNVLGVSKLMGEKLILSSYYYQGEKTTKFACVRFGNVLGTNGSIVPLLKNQIKNSNFITLTDPDMTRFMLSVPQAVKLVFDASQLMQGQEIFILKMPSIKLKDLAESVVKLYAPIYGKKEKDIKIKIIGVRKGEKRHEKLLTSEESKYAMELNDMYILTPNEKVWNFEYKKKYPSAKKLEINNYDSDKVVKLTKEEIKKILINIDNELH